MKLPMDYENRKWRHRAALIAVLDVLCIMGAYFFALLLRHDFLFSTIDPIFVQGYLDSIGLWCAVTLVAFYIGRLYHSIWRQVSIKELEMICKVFACLVPLYYLVVKLTKLHMPRSYYVMGMIIHFGLTALLRFSYRMARLLSKSLRSRGDHAAERIMVIGAGVAGQMIIRELQSSGKLHGKVVCAIDDNPNKRGLFMEGVEIVGNRQDIVYMAEKYRVTRIIFAIPSCPLKERTAILNQCKMTGCKLQTIPGVYQLMNQEVSITQLRDVDIADLLGREQVQVNNEEIFQSIAGKVVLVTGGGGSIGSELCRQIARANPKQLVIFDIYENNAYAIQQELKRALPELNLETLIGSVRNTNRINHVMRTYRPDIVFHAAAHKHVPLMEDSPNEAIKNNVLGTYKTATAAVAAGVGKFVLISTDKAVNPTNIMGASKRLCEMVVQMMDRKSEHTSFAAVRFDNVLGSNGSVIPLFKQQIAAGGPVTVTDKRIIRYFMTIPEAVSLVLQASYYASGGEIFVLDMGEPVKIDDMARNLIRLSGLQPDEDIPIVYIGLRPGEKLYEELLLDEEGLQETDNKMIHVGKPIEMDDDWFRKKLEELDTVSRQETGDIRALVSQLVPTYRYCEEKV